MPRRSSKKFSSRRTGFVDWLQSQFEPSAALRLGRRRLGFEWLEPRQMLSVAVANGPEFEVNRFTTGSQQNPRVAADAAGDYVVVWQSAGQDGSSYGIYAQRYSSSGAPQGTEFRVNTFTTGAQQLPAVAMDAAGDFVVAWESNQDGSNYGIYAQRYNSAGATQGGEFKVNTFTNSLQTNPSAAMDSTGDFVIAWQSYGEDGSSYGVYAQRYNAAGTAQASEFKVSSYTTNVQKSASVAMDSTGDFVIAWQSYGEDGSVYGVYAQRYNSAGAAMGSEFKVNTYTSNHQELPRVAMDSAGDFVVAWQSQSEDGSLLGIYAQRYNSAAVAQGTEFRVNTYTTGNQYNPTVSMDSAGDFVVAWQSLNQDGNNYGVFAQRYNATGTAQGQEFQVNTYTVGNQRSPAIAMDGLGDFVVAWQSDGQDGSGIGVIARRYVVPAAGAIPSPAGSEFQVNTYTTGSQQYSSVASDAAGDYVVAWTEYGGEDGNTAGVYAQRYSAAGAAEASEFKVNTFTTGKQANPSVAMDAAGDFVVAWVSYNEGTIVQGIFAQRFSAAGAAQGSEFLVNTYTTGTQSEPRLAMDSAGDFVVTWYGSGNDGSSLGVYARRYNSAGVALGSEFQVNTYTTGAQRLSAIAMDAAGDFVVTWASFGEDGSGYGIYAQRYSAAGVTLGSEFRINTATAGNQTNPAVAMDSIGDFVVDWAGYFQNGAYAIYAQRYNSAGAAQGSAFQVNTNTNSGKNLPSVAMDSTGDFVAVWQSNNQDGSSYGIFAQHYNAAGVAQGGEFQVNTYVTGKQSSPSAAMDSGGDFVIAWNSNQDGSGYGIYAQRYTVPQSGAIVGPIGSEFRVNTYTSSDEYISSVAADAAGDFVVTWSGYEHGGEGSGGISDVYAQRYNAAGVPLATEFMVNTFSANKQFDSQIAMDAAGDFVIVWLGLSESGGSDYDLYAQRYNPAGVPQGSQFRVNTYTTDEQRSVSVAMDAAGDFVVTWYGDTKDGGALYDIYAQRFNAAGVAQGSEFLVNTNTTQEQQHAVVAMDAAGDFVIAWQNNDAGEVSVRRFNAAGVAQGSEFQVSSLTTGTQSSPSVAMDPAGDFVVAWQGQDASGAGSFAERFNAAGAAQGSSFQINTYTPGGEVDPVVAMDAAGDFVVSWEVRYAPDDPSYYGVYAQRYNATGAAQGSEFLVNTYTTNFQEDPAIAMDALGDFIVTWDSRYQDGSGFGVYAQRYGYTALPVLADPGFEVPPLGSGPTAYQYDPTASPWKFVGTAGVTGNGSAFTMGNPSAPQGAQAAFIQVTGSLSQSVTVSAVGTYDITFEAAQRAIGPSNQTFEVLVDSTLVGTFTPSGTSYSLYTTPTFSVPAGAHTIEFLGLDPKGGDNTALIDQVSLQAAPANQPVDAGFELPPLGAGSSAYQYNPTASPWTFSGDAGVAGNGSAFTAGNPNAPRGGQVAFLQITGSVSQTVSIAAGVYYVNLLAAQRGVAQPNQTIEVLIDGQLVGSITPAGTSYSSYTSNEFVVGVSGNHTLTLLGQDPLGGDNTALIDQVSVQSVTASQLSDAGFESTIVGTGSTAYQYDPAGASPWTFSGDAGVAGNNSPFTTGNPKAPQGSQVAFIQFTGSASQSVTLGGGTYSISLEAAQRAVGPSNQTIEVLVDNALVGTITPSSTSYALYTTPTFYAASGTHTIEILGLDPHGGDNTALIDQVSIVAVPANQPHDPGFESPSLGSGPAAYELDPTNSAWTFSGDAGLAGNASGYTASNPNAPQGSQVAFIQVTGSMSQSFAVAPGVYNVNLIAAQRAIGASKQTIQVLIDGQVVGSITPGSTNYSYYYTGDFAIGTGGAHTLTFVGLDPFGGDNTAFIDSVSLQTVDTNQGQPLDAGFESPFAGPAAYQYDATGSAWTYSGDAGVAGNGSGFTASNPNAPQGNQVAFIQITGSMSESMTMSVGTYSISLDAAQRAIGSSNQTIEVLIDGTVISSITPTSTNYALYTTTTFTVAYGSHTIEILGLDPHGGDNTALIDQVSIVVAQANQPLDPGFEAPSLGAGAAAYQYDPTGSPWTFSGFAGVAGNGSAFTAGGANAPQGGQAAFIQITGSLSQSVTLAAGTYTISLDAAQRGNVSQAGQAIEVLVDNNVVSTITPSSANYAEYSTATFTVTAGTHSIKLLGLDPHGGDNTALIDQVFLNWL